eukprot:COSAG06_NODE_11664_length_1479_cov_3.152174_1_plen_301_part_00
MNERQHECVILSALFHPHVQVTSATQEGHARLRARAPPPPPVAGSTCARVRLLHTRGSLPRPNRGVLWRVVACPQTSVSFGPHVAPQTEVMGMAARMESRARAGPSGGASGGQKKPRKSGGGMFACCSAPVAVASLEEGSVLESACHIQFNGKVTSSSSVSSRSAPGPQTGAQSSSQAAVLVWCLQGLAYVQHCTTPVVGPQNQQQQQCKQQAVDSAPLAPSDPARGTSSSEPATRGRTPTLLATTTLGGAQRQSGTDFILSLGFALQRANVRMLRGSSLRRRRNRAKGCFGQTERDLSF